MKTQCFDVSFTRGYIHDKKKIIRKYTLRMFLNRRPVLELEGDAEGLFKDLPFKPP